MTDEIERLKQELAVARETNRRLNRRCQELEHEVAVITNELKSVVDLLRYQAHRVHGYANGLRDLYHHKKNGLNAWYASYWKQLPRGEEEFIDGIPQRVKAALRIIKENEHS